MEADLTPPSGERYRALSLWWDGLPGDLTVRPGLPGDLEVDVAVVGGGLTGLWTAYYLSEADPTLRIAVLERDVAGFGASGRNGGWCSALFSVSESTLDKAAGPGSGTAQRLAMQETVREVGHVVTVEGIGCGFTEAVRGVLSHHMVIKGGKIANYHPYPPTPWNANPRDSFGTPGPYEDAVTDLPIFEENRGDKFKGIDIMRTVRSFDPCLPCGVHMYLGGGKVVKKLHSPTQVSNPDLAC